MTTNANFLELVQCMRTAKNPQEMACTLVEQKMGSNPFFSNLLQLARGGRGNEIEAIARNALKEKGLDFDKEFNSFRKSMGL